MTIVNRRNAVVGFLAIKVGKTVARRKAKQVGGKIAPPWGSKETSKNGKKGEKESNKS
ncbi:MAG TPA: hypothetical protein VH541_07360 [Gaiellaceae bacterium]|jgi:hypothetical protein